MSATTNEISQTNTAPTGSWLQRLRRTRYLMLGLLCLMYFIAYVDRVNIGVAAPLLRKELGLSPTELGFVFSAFAYPYAAMQIAGGWLADRYGPRAVLTLLSLVWGIATVMTGFAWGLMSLVMFRFLLGIGEGGAFPTATRAFTYWMPAHERGFAQGITHSFARLGGAITPPAVLAIVAVWGWRESFYVLGAISLVWTAFWLLMYRDQPAQHRWVGAAELAELRSDPIPHRQLSDPTPWRKMISSMWVTTFVDFCYGWSLWVFLTWLPSYLKEARGFDLKHLALFTSLPLLAGVVGDTLGGVASDRLYRRTGNLRWARRSMLLVGLFGSLAFISPAARTDSSTMAVWLLSASFFFLELTNATLWSLPLDIAGRFAGTAAGMMNTGFGVAGMVSPVAFGFIIQSTGSYDLAFYLSAALLAIGGVASFFIDPTRTLEPQVERKNH